MRRSAAVARDAIVVALVRGIRTRKVSAAEAQGHIVAESGAETVKLASLIASIPNPVKAANVPAYVPCITARKLGYDATRYVNMRLFCALHNSNLRGRTPRPRARAGRT
ncbi:hypothetical protein HCU64_11475 [Methylobacterium sp. C25]|uniref:hypothetical protein n=1 Tax=Methylobacterium sp. C25 TaxID=2721622 RepID=UPI001F37FD03|nr:hypothetical protein [Methylobacterium sp. C25]MCE4224373.1 hypothetical protein [Methylobacterium sp. C25]